MAYDLEKGKKVLLDTIQYDLYHEDYDRVTKIADEYTKFVTGVDVGSLLRRFVPREDAEAFKQRLALSQLTTPDMANRIAAPMYKIGRSRADESFRWIDTNDADKKKTELIGCLGKFYGDESVDKYLNQKMVELDCTDPNAFIIVEFAGVYDPKNPDKKIKPYPFEVDSENAINYKYINNELQFLIVETDFTETDQDGKIVELDKYTQYLENENIVATQIQKQNLAKYLSLNPLAEIFYENPEDKDRSDIYIIEVFEHKAGRVQARRVGTRKDISTGGRTCVPMMHPAYCYFEKSIKTISEFDLTNCLHVFQKLVQYDEVCPGNREKNIICNAGKMPDQHDCPECRGTGWKNHKSSADIIRVKMPKDPKDMANLQNFMAYFGPEMELLKFQKDFGFYELNELAIKAVYTSDLFVSGGIVATATEKTIDLESVYDALKPFADSYSSMKMHIAYCVAEFRNIGDGFSYLHQFPKNFKMESLEMLLDSLTRANTSGAPSYIKNEINRDIANKIYADKPHELYELDTKASYFPFNGKSIDEINNIILNDLTTKYNKVLYANFENIFAQIEEESEQTGLDFYQLEKSKQTETVKAKVLQLIAELDSELAAERSASFNQNIPGA